MAQCGLREYAIHQRQRMAVMDNWRIWLGRLGALSAQICRISGLIVSLYDDFTWKLDAQGWFTGVGLRAVVIYLDAAAAKKQYPRSDCGPIDRRK